jgi:hypothetical protein
MSKYATRILSTLLFPAYHISNCLRFCCLLFCILSNPNVTYKYNYVTAITIWFFPEKWLLWRTTPQYLTGGHQHMKLRYFHRCFQHYPTVFWEIFWRRKTRALVVILCWCPGLVGERKSRPKLVLLAQKYILKFNNIFCPCEWVTPAL